VGTYYSISYGWGLRIDANDAPDYEDGFYEWVNDVTPDGFVYSVGGNHFDGTGQAALVSPDGGIYRLLHTSGLYGENYGVFGDLENDFCHTDEQLVVLMKLAREYGLPENIGWFVVSSVG
jgi:hypothetical protein